MRQGIKQWVFGLGMLLFMGAVAWMGLKTVGHYAIRLAYENRFPVKAFNAIIADEGRQAHAAEFYTDLADSFFYTYAPGLVALSLLLLGLLRLFQFVAAKSAGARDLVFPAVSLGLGFLLLPPVARHLLATGPWAPEDLKALWAVALLWVLGSLATLLWRPALPSALKRTLAVVFLAVAMEYAFRLAVVVFMPGLKKDLHVYGIRTYFYSYVIEGHPFLQYSPKPGVVSDRILAAAPLEGEDRKAGRQGLRHPKPAGTIRVVALGGSTVERGWPDKMGAQLNARDSGRHFEVFNYGVAYYNSAHMVVNFALNALHYDPDFVLIHEAWNDVVCRNTDPAAFRTDYSHVLTSFHEPEIPDRGAIRISAIYRWIRMRITPHPFWWDIPAVLTRPKVPLSEEPWSREEELIPYRSNIQAIIDLAKARGVRAVLTTQPYSTRPMRQADVAPHVEQCNAILRQIARAEGDQILFVDLAEHFKDRWDDHFMDLGHVDEAADLEKARRVGEAIESDLRRRGPASDGQKN